MDKYTVKINPKTFRDLNSIFEYIAHKKLSPENALGQIRRIKTAILGLNYFPQAHQERLEGRFARKGYRQLLVDNYIIIFRIDEKTKTVYVVTVQYYRRLM